MRGQIDLHEQIFASAGHRDGIPQIALPLPGGDGHHRCLLGTIRLTTEAECVIVFVHECDQPIATRPPSDDADASAALLGSAFGFNEAHVHTEPLPGDEERLQLGPLTCQREQRLRKRRRFRREFRAPILDASRTAHNGGPSHPARFSEGRPKRKRTAILRNAILRGQTNFQPLWYGLRTSTSASGAFFAFRLTGSHSIFLPMRYATLPR